MEDKRCVFVPDGTNTWLLSKPEQLTKMTELAEQGKIGFTMIGTLSFVDLTVDGASYSQSIKQCLTELIEMEAQEGEEEEDDEEEDENAGESKNAEDAGQENTNDE